MATRKRELIEYWKDNLDTVTYIVAYLNEEDILSNVINYTTSSIHRVLNIETYNTDWFLYIGEASYTANFVNNNRIMLDKTYISDLTAPTEEELNYLEILLGSDVVESYKQMISPLNKEIRDGLL